MTDLTYETGWSCICEIQGYDGDFIHFCRLHEAAQKLLDALIATKPEGCWCPPQKNGKPHTRHGPVCKQALNAITWAQRTD